jgi:hypothetical protein
VKDPSSWRKYLALELDHEAADFAAFSRYRARYKLAQGLDSITVEGLSQATTDSYFAALRVTLAYTALEALEAALSDGPGTQVQNVKLIEQLLHERNSEMCQALLESIDPGTHQREREKFRKLLDGESKNLRSAAYAIRNLMAHGVLTANRLGLDKSRARRQLLNDLADCVLAAADKRFSNHVNTESISKK